MSIINDKKQISKPTTNVIKSPLAEHLRKRYPAYMNGVDNLRQSGIGLQTMADNGIYVDKLGLAFPYRVLRGI